jgi:hypothetical protein
MFVLARMLGLACPCLPVRGCVPPYLQMTLALPVVLALPLGLLVSFSPFVDMHHSL